MPRPIHFELAADDPDRCARFYADVFGWKVEKWGGPTDYWLVGTGEAPEPGIDGGIGRRDAPGEHTTNTIGVESVDATLEQVVAAGGKVIRGKDAVPGVGWVAYCEDSEGNAFGLMQDDPSAA